MVDLDPFIGQIELFGFNFAPRGWAKCEGQILSISSNQALFSLLGTTYGGDGRTTFALPDLRGRAALHTGTGPGLSTYSWGQKSGSPSSPLVPAQLPPHTHSVAPACDDVDQQCVSQRGYTCGSGTGGTSSEAFLTCRVREYSEQDALCPASSRSV